MRERERELENQSDEGDTVLLRGNDALALLELVSKVNSLGAVANDLLLLGLQKGFVLIQVPGQGGEVNLPLL